MLLVLLTMAWSIGLWIGHQWPIARPCPLVMGILYGAAGVVILIQVLYRKHIDKRYALVSLALLAGIWRMILAQPIRTPPYLIAYNDQGQCAVTGYVCKEPQVRDTWTQLVVRTEAIEHNGAHEPVVGKMLISASHYPQYQYGDRIQVTGKLQTPPIFRDFDYREYLASQGIRSQMQRPSIEKLDGCAGYGIIRTILRSKAHVQATIDRIMPYPEAGLLSGILIGANHGLSPDIDEDFRHSGLTHIIVISGYNVSLVILALTLITKPFLHRWLAIGLAIVGTIFYALFVGISPPVSRAAIVVGLVLIGQWLGRKSHLLTSLAFASLLMTAINPLLLWSVSFQLSFISTLALILLEPVLADRWNKWLIQDHDEASVRIARIVGDMVLVTLCAQIATFPLLWYHFQEASPWALLANMLALPVQPLIILLGSTATLFGLIHPLAGRVAGWVVWPLLRLTIGVAGFTADLPGAALTLPDIPAILVWLIYILILVLVVGRKTEHIKQPKPTKPAISKSTVVVLAALLLIAATTWIAVSAAPDGRLHVYMLDIGQGDAILIVSPRGTTVLVDGGADPVRLASCLGQSLPFWQKRIDLLVATHIDQDHLGGLVPILSNYDVDQVIESPLMPDNALCQAWRQALQEAEISPSIADRGMEINLDEQTRLTVLHPRCNHLVSDDSNANSIVMRLEMEQFEMLLTADIDAETEAYLVASQAPLQADLLKVAHHGAKTSSSSRFISRVAPTVALISVGGDNRFGHPHQDVLDTLDAAGCQTLRTDQAGTIECISDGRQLWIRTQH